jgi:hypothetical protein
MNKAESRKLTAESFSRLLDTFGIPDPELVVRTGGKKRLSGFTLAASTASCILWIGTCRNLLLSDWMKRQKNMLIASGGLGNKTT